MSEAAVSAEPSTARPPLRPTTVPPGPRPLNPVASLRELRRDQLAFFTGLARTYGPIASFRVGPQRLVAVSDPDAIRHVLQDNARNYDKQTRGFDEVRLLLGQGLLTSEGSFWLRQRRLAQPAFHRQRLAAFGSTFSEGARALADEWAPLAKAGSTIDVTAAFTKLTLSLASDTLFGADLSDQAREIAEALAVALQFANGRLLTLLDWPDFVPTAAHRRAAKARDTLDRVVRGLVDRRRREGSQGRTDLLALLMEAKDADTGETMNDQQLRDEVMTLLLAGHETTANALQWIAVLLSQNPHARRRLEAELDEMLGDRDATVEDVPKLVYTRMVIDEAMRLFPPAWIFSRRPLADDALGGYRIPAGSYVLLSSYVTHHDPKLWPNPEGFDPERFHPDRVAAQPRYGYFPFGGGPRQCIGNNFALLEMTIVLATLARRVHLDLLPNARVVPEPTITLRPKGGLRMMLRPR